MKWLLRRRSILLGLLLALLPWTLVGAPTAQALGDCGFGAFVSDYDQEVTPICEKTKWSIEESNDGFDRVVVGSVPVDNSEITNDPYDFSLVVRCTSKKLEVYGSNTSDLFYQNAYKSGGPVQVKFDSGKVTNYKFTKSTSNKGFFLNNPKTFATALSKAKSRVALKFSSSRGIIVLQFPSADFATSKKIYSKAGCQF
jgi:hypothetical protein